MISSRKKRNIKVEVMAQYSDWNGIKEDII